MSAVLSKLNPFERILFASAVVVAGLIIAVRLVMMATVWYLNHGH